ncbi:hypothetical protein RB653_010329 [Dictyostelium firmibasis]|uniref:Saposin B-type domain-containing protein n=1 Tax=Dictyostelium firmibasis TaxID=79012 RepID=A0AAN7U112_9MYCE
MKFIITLLIIFAVLINSAFGAISILDLKHQCKSYCSAVSKLTNDFVEKNIGQKNVESFEQHLAQDFKNAFPSHYEKLVDMKNYFESCEHGCDALVDDEIKKYLQ